MKNSPLRPSTTPLERRTPLRPGKRKKRWQIPPAVRAAVYARSHGACVMCLHKAGVDPARASVAAVRMLARCHRSVSPAAQIHHVLPVEHFPELERDLANMVALCPGCHDEHERATRRLPRAILPVCVVLLAAGVPKRVAYLDRIYPTVNEAA